MAEDVNKMFESLFGFGSQPHPKPSPLPKPPIDVEPTPPHEPAEAPGTVEDAAQAVAVALEAHYARKGSRKAVKLVYWRPTVAKALGIKRIYEKRLLEVIHKGVHMRLYELDEEGKHPFIVPIPEEEPDPEWDALVARQEAEKVRLAEMTSVRPLSSPQPPENWDPPGFLDCGHWTWQVIPKSEEDYTAKEKAQIVKSIKDKTYGNVKPRVTVRVHSPDECHYCERGRQPDSYQHQKGKYRVPIPENRRRTVEKDQGHGYPGLCAHQKTGFYIGGLGNHCRYASPKRGPWCVVHAPKRGTGRVDRDP